MQAELKVRRARRDDFARVRALLGEREPGDRADRKRFRRLVSTLREDLYLVERAGDEQLAGLAVIVYVRGLGPTTAIVRGLRGSDEAATLLLDCARERAAARGCTRLEVHVDHAEGHATPTISGEAWHDGPRIYYRTVTA
jgi:ribosomal protein S18 acetylase RimI-like enzyme